MEDLLVVKNLVQEFKSHSGFLDSIKLKDGRLIREKKAVHAVNDVSLSLFMFLSFLASAARLWYSVGEGGVAALTPQNKRKGDFYEVEY